MRISMLAVVFLVATSFVYAGDIQCMGFGKYMISTENIYLKYDVLKSYSCNTTERKIEILTSKPSRQNVEFASVCGYGKEDEFLSNAQKIVKARGGDAYYIVAKRPKGDGAFEFVGLAVRYTD